MKYVEQGIDKEGNICWFVLEDANLLNIYTTQEEALANL